MKINAEIKNSILREMKEELNEREYEYTSNALNKIVEECFERKQQLLDLFSKHPNWNPEKLMIQFDTDVERSIDLRQIVNFLYWMESKINVAYNPWCDEQTKEYKIYRFIRYCIEDQFFNEDMREEIDKINKLNENYKLRTNMKSSKAIGKIFREEGWDKLEGFNKAYADLSNALSPLKITRHTCISLNPIDFLLMSNGNSWNSCHYIGDDSYNAGCYSSGTISYMLDEHSFVFYTVDASYCGDQIEREKKIQRQIFGYNDEVLAQLRLYPQSNDCGATMVYQDIRQIVQKVIADCLGKPNLWIRSKKATTEVIEHGHNATCYPDWYSHNPGGKHCSISTLKDRENGIESRKIVFGAEPICIDCGSRHYCDGSISCCDNDEYDDEYDNDDDYTFCDICGHRIHVDDANWGGRYGDVPYCDSCCTYCEDCEIYYPNNEVTEVDGRYVCDDCISDGSYYRCDGCGVLHHSDYLIYDEETEADYCEECYDELIEKRMNQEEVC